MKITLTQSQYQLLVNWRDLYSPEQTLTAFLATNYNWKLKHKFVSSDTPHTITLSGETNWSAVLLVSDADKDNPHLTFLLVS